MSERLLRWRMPVRLKNGRIIPIPPYVRLSYADYSVLLRGQRDAIHTDQIHRYIPLRSVLEQNENSNSDELTTHCDIDLRDTYRVLRWWWKWQ